MPERFALEFQADDGEWMLEAICLAEQFYRQDDGSYICAPIGQRMRGLLRVEAAAFIGFSNGAESVRLSRRPRVVVDRLGEPGLMICLWPDTPSWWARHRQIGPTHKEVDDASIS
jgi:hypothetical protein